MVRRIFSDRGRLTALVIALAVVVFLLAGCQTVQGIGKDITSVGKAGERLLEKP